MKFLPKISIWLLFITGILALLGGIPLVLNPNGALNQMSVAWLEGSPFHNFLIPGLILSIGIGLYSLLTALAGWRHQRYFPAMTAFAGLILIIWISVQMLIIPVFSFLQPLFMLVGLVLVWVGML